MPIPTAQDEIAAFLTALAGAPALETHISAIFRGAGTVWKLKKAVRLSFLDFSTLEARRHYVAREYALNAPAAPGLYRDVVAVIRRGDGSLALCAHPPEGAEILDYVLRMARVPDADFLDRLADAGGLDAAMQDALGDAVAAYHQGLAPARGTDPVVGMRAVLAGNETAALTAGLPEARVRAWRAEAEDLLAAAAPFLRARAEAGFVRRAHGDLHLGNLCLWQGRIVPFDALEFDEALATIDLGYDLAFLLMDVEQRAGRAAANRVMNRYIARTGDVGLTRFLPLFLSCRALIRAHVAARSGAADQALTYLSAAAAYQLPVPAVVLAIGGLPGTGKSTLARALAPDLGRAPGAVILRSDEIRKRLHGVAPEVRLPATAYAEEESERVFAAMAQALHDAAGGGQAVIADATFLAAEHRALIARAAMGAAFHGVWLHAPMAELERRIGARVGDASDATVAVLRAAAGRGADSGAWLVVDTTDLATALARLRETLPLAPAAC